MRSATPHGISICTGKGAGQAQRAHRTSALRYNTCFCLIKAGGGGGVAFKGYIRGDVRKDRIHSLSDTPRRDQEGKRGGARAELGPCKLPLVISMLFIQKTDTATPPGTRGSALHIPRCRGGQGGSGPAGTDRARPQGASGHQWVIWTSWEEAPSPSSPSVSQVCAGGGDGSGPGPG